MSYLSPLSRNFSSGEEIYGNLEKLGGRLGHLQDSRNEVRKLSSVLKELPEPMRQSRPSALSPKVGGISILLGTALIAAVRLFNAPRLDLSIVSKAIAIGAGSTVAAVALIVSAAVTVVISKESRLWPEVSNANNRLDALEPGLQRLQRDIEQCTEGVDEVLAHFGPKNRGNQTQN